MSVMWFKKANGEIKPYELNEIIPKDNKDLQIEYLQTQIEELKGMIKNEIETEEIMNKMNIINYIHISYIHRQIHF